MARDPDEPVAVDQTAQLEQAFILEFLERRGHTPGSVHQLPPAEAMALMKEASLYASSRLTEVESRAQYVHDIHDATHRRES
jgi:hypothetical protein